MPEGECQHYSEIYSVGILVNTITVSPSPSFLCAWHPAQEKWVAGWKQQYLCSGRAVGITETATEKYLVCGVFCLVVVVIRIEKEHTFVFSKQDLIHFTYVRLTVRSWKETGGSSDIGDRAMEKGNTRVWTTGPTRTSSRERGKKVEAQAKASVLQSMKWRKAQNKFNLLDTKDSAEAGYAIIVYSCQSSRVSALSPQHWEWDIWIESRTIYTCRSLDFIRLRAESGKTSPCLQHIWINCHQKLTIVGQA